MATQREEWVKASKGRAEAYMWGESRKYDHILHEGVEKGLSFDEYSRQTGCPQALRERYEDLLDEHRVAERQKNDLFLKGFAGGGV